MQVCGMGGIHCHFCSSCVPGDGAIVCFFVMIPCNDGTP